MGRGGANEKRRDFDRAAALKGGNGLAGLHGLRARTRLRHPRLPESAGDYLCLVKYCNMVTGEMEKMQRTGYFTPLGGGAWGGDAVRGARATVLAWMPLSDGLEVE